MSSFRAVCEPAPYGYPSTMPADVDVLVGRSSPPVAVAVNFARVFDSLPTPYAVLSPDLEFVEVNPAYCAAVLRRRDELVGSNIFDTLPLPYRPQIDGEAGTEDPVERIRASLQRVVRSGRPDPLPLTGYPVRDPVTGLVGERFWSILTAPVLDDEGGVEFLLQRAQDVTDFVRARAEAGSAPTGTMDKLSGVSGEAEVFARSRELEQLNTDLRRARDQLATSALHDSLTGLLVRPVFTEYVTTALSRLARHPHPLAVLFVDLDGLKQINDGLGHAAGDQLITVCAQRLKAGVRPSDPVARFGGDEFVVLLEDLTDAGEAGLIAARMLESLAAPCTLASGASVRPSASIGIAITTSADTSVDLLLSQADAAMYRAKQNGKGRVEVFDEASHSAERARRLMGTQLRGALARGEMVLHYQPIIDLTTGATFAVEALLRWQHPERGLLPAADFIEIAEDTGAIVELGSWAVAEACRQLAAWDAQLGPRAPSRLFLNLSVAELVQPRLEAQVAAITSAAGVDPHRLVLEITETGILDELRTRSEVVEVLERLGCELAIDDFGTGYSSLSRLVQLPAGILKIDRSFVQALTRDHESTAVVSAVLLLAHNLRKTVIASGVEDAAALAVLQELGCPYGQGFHLSAPLTPQQFADRVRRPDAVRLDAALVDALQV